MNFDNQCFNLILSRVVPPRSKAEVREFAPQDVEARQMIAQDYVDKISVRFRRYPDIPKMLPSAESLLKGLAVAMVGLILLMGYTRGVDPMSEENTQMVKVTVDRGGTLWQYATKYGSKDRYILSRVEEIARINHIPGSRAIQPGDQILIPK